MFVFLKNFGIFVMFVIKKILFSFFLQRKTLNTEFEHSTFKTVWTRKLLLIRVVLSKFGEYQLKLSTVPRSPAHPPAHLPAAACTRTQPTPPARRVGGLFDHGLDEGALELLHHVAPARPVLQLEYALHHRQLRPTSTRGPG